MVLSHNHRGGQRLRQALIEPCMTIKNREQLKHFGSIRKSFEQQYIMRCFTIDCLLKFIRSESFLTTKIHIIAEIALLTIG